MAILQFPKKRIVQREPEGARKKGDPWRLVDLHDSRPLGHPPVRRTRFGKVILNVEQVWVDLATDELWVVWEIIPHYHRSKYARVHLKRYRARPPYLIRELSESNLRGQMRVWDDMREFKQDLVEKLREEFPVSTPPQTRQRALVSTLRFFGLDARGNRID